VSAIVLYAIAFHMIGAPFPRYGVPFRPLLYMLAILLASTPFRRREPAQLENPSSGPGNPAHNPG